MKRIRYPAAIRGGRERTEPWLAPLQAGWKQAARDLAAGWADLRRQKSWLADVIAGLTVAAVALPLNVALARASGLPASAGLIAGALGGMVAALLGGASLQVTGPAAALSTLVLVIAKDFGVAGVAAATIGVGIIQLVLSALLAGRAARLVPESVLAGFTTGVGLKILDQQIPELLGFEMLGKDYKFMDMARMMHAPKWLHHVSWQSVVCGLIVAFLVTTTKQYKRFPAAILGVALVTFVSTYLGWQVERIGELPATLPQPTLPLVPDERWLDLLVAILPLALLASVESLLSGRAIDRMTGTKKPFNPNLELFGQGVANLVVGSMSGMPVTGVIVRSGVNVQAGAKTRLSAFIHGAMLLVAVLFLSKTIALVPEAALAGLLLVIGMRLIEIKTFVELVQKEKLEALAFAAAAAGTVSGHLLTGLVAGMVLAAIHHRMHHRKNEQRADEASRRERGVRAVVAHAGARRPHTSTSPEAHRWLPHVEARAHIPKSAFVHPKSSVIGRVVLGEHVHIAAGSSVRADEGTPFFIGPGSNIQDGVVIHALQNQKVLVAGEEWAVYVGSNVSMAHDALVHGPCYIGDDTFLGFKSVVHDAVIGSRCFVGIGAVVVGVEIPDGKFIPHGAVIDSADAVDRLRDVTEAQTEFNEDVVDVNRGLAAAYHVADGRAPAPTAVAGQPAGPDAPDVWAESWTHTSTGPGRF